MRPSRPQTKRWPAVESPATTSTTAVRQFLGSANAETTPAGARPQRPSESSGPMHRAKGRMGDCPGPRKETATRRNVTQGGRISAKSNSRGEISLQEFRGRPDPLLPPLLSCPNILILDIWSYSYCSVPSHQHCLPVIFKLPFAASPSLRPSLERSLVFLLMLQATHCPLTCRKTARNSVPMLAIAVMRQWRPQHARWRIPAPRQLLTSPTFDKIAPIKCITMCIMHWERRIICGMLNVRGGVMRWRRRGRRGLPWGEGGQQAELHVTTQHHPHWMVAGITALFSVASPAISHS